jgi:hypothetical protein
MTLMRVMIITVLNDLDNRPGRVKLFRVCQGYFITLSKEVFTLQMSVLTIRSNRQYIPILKRSERIRLPPSGENPVRRLMFTQSMTAIRKIHGVPPGGKHLNIQFRLKDPNIIRV